MSIRNQRVVSRIHPYSVIRNGATIAADAAAAASDVDARRVDIDARRVDVNARRVVDDDDDDDDVAILSSSSAEDFSVAPRFLFSTTTTTTTTAQSFRERAKFECAVCLESYVEEKFENSLFLMPKTCTHAICFKCVVGLYNSGPIGMRKCPPLKCPLCKTIVPFWVTCTKNSTVECRFYKRTGSKQMDQVTIDYFNHWDRMKARCANQNAITPSEDDTIAKLNAMLCVENKNKKTNAKTNV
ncbi:pe38 [Cyclophragma undans nucleopolyhedrovirus]|uniref:Pe38 n=1 Tax=Cyclophragma undans nucleopolyhedrovirus TaxID=1906244 RepID=A0A288Q7Y2_9ABAC|nr:pe38 [Cyclophragma undans nucleopolyhedrovirus]AOT85476.1 pe38 [Cyclophragma undans nucleopolyhedrovirus]